MPAVVFATAMGGASHWYYEQERRDAAAMTRRVQEARVRLDNARRERDNLMQVLEVANWKIGGPDGAAELLGVKPTTLLSRMDKWGIKKPER